MCHMHPQLSDIHQWLSLLKGMYSFQQHVLFTAQIRKVSLRLNGIIKLATFSEFVIVIQQEESITLVHLKDDWGLQVGGIYKA